MLRKLYITVHALADVLILVAGVAHALTAMYLDFFKQGQGLDHHLAWAAFCLAVIAMDKERT